MTDSPSRFIRIYRRDDEGNLYDDRETFALDDFGGTIPRVGEFIVSRWLRNTNSTEHARQAGRLWEHRTVAIVEAVYHRPDKRDSEKDDIWVVLVLRDRPMEESEQALI